MKNFVNSLIKKLKKMTTTPKISQKNIKGKLMGKFSSKTSAKFFTSNDSLSIDAKQTFIKEEINAEARLILKEAVENPEILVNFIKLKGTRVIKSRYMKPVLFLFREQIGFLPPMKGFKALALNILLNIISRAKLNIENKTPELFVLDDKPVNIYFLSHQFHLWLSYINELPGFDEATRENFKNIWDSNLDSMEVGKLSIEEIVALKDAMARDMEALKFVKEMTREFVGQKQSLDKIKKDGSTNI